MLGWFIKKRISNKGSKRRGALPMRSFGIEPLEDRTVPASTAQLLFESSPGHASSYPRSFANLDNRTFFVAGDNFSQGDKGGLHVTDGTAAGTRRVEAAGRRFSDVNYVAAMGSYVYFAAKDIQPNGTSEYGIELWRSDGTTVGTTLVKDIAPGTGNSSPTNITAVGNKVFFSVTNPQNGQDSSLWMSDGTAAGTKRVKDINPAGSDSIYIPHGTGYNAVCGNLLYFRAATSNQLANYQIYRTDGTEAGTFKITDDANGILYPKLTPFNGKMYWGGESKINYTDGTLAGTGSHAAFVGTTFSLTNLGNKLAYVAEPFVPGGNYNILTTTGNNAGSLAVALDSSYRWFGSKLFAAGNKVFLTRDGVNAQQSDHGAQVFSIDLNASTSTLLKSIAVDGKQTQFYTTVAASDKLYFLLQSNDQYTNSNYKLHESDGTIAGTTSVINAVTGMPAETSVDYGIHVTSNNQLLTGLTAPGTGIEAYKIGGPVGEPAIKPRTDIVGRYNEAGQWYVGTSNGTSFSTAYWGTWSPGVAWLDVQQGDFNGDGLKDIVGRYGAAGQWYVGLSTGSSYTTSLWGVWSPGVTWADVKVGDFNRDGRDDIVGRWKEGGQWYVGLSTGTAFNTSFFAYWSPGVTWTDVAVGDFNGDGRSDIVGRWMESGQWYVGLSTETSFATSYFGAWSPGPNWLDVKFADLNADGRADVVGRLASSGEWYAGVSNGTGFTTSLWGVWSTINWVDVAVGDFNGDGKADIAGRWKETGQWYVGTSTGTAFATSYFGAWSSGATWVDVKVGDFDGDGKADLVGRHKEAGQWYVGRSTGSAFSNALWATWSAGATWADCAVANAA